MNIHRKILRIDYLERRSLFNSYVAIFTTLAPEMELEFLATIKTAMQKLLFLII